MFSGYLDELDKKQMKGFICCACVIKFVCVQISRAWTVDVMRFFLDRGSDLLQPDQFGVTALHVASALDYQDMVQFLLDKKGLCEVQEGKERIKENSDILLLLSVVPRVSPQLLREQIV